MSQAAEALRATERAERAERQRAERSAPAASRWTSPGRRAFVQGALGLTGLTAAALALTGADFGAGKKEGGNC